MSENNKTYNCTLSMIVKNEEKYLRDCLESVKDVVDEIVIVDTGSTDQTLKIAKEYDAKIFHFEWINDFSEARNYALSKTSGRWVLYLDADERLSNDSKKELKEIVLKNENAAYKCIVSSIDTHNSKPNVFKYPRLFKYNPKLKFVGSIHEQIYDSLLKEKYKIKESSIEIIHVGYDIGKEEMNKKAERNLSLLLNEYNKCKSDYVTFQLAQTYGVLDDKVNAKKYFDEIISLKNCPAFYKAYAYRYLAAIELQENRLETALDYANKGLKYDKEQPLLNMVTSKIYLAMNRYNEALQHCKNAIENNSKSSTKEFEIIVDEKQLIYLGLQESTLAGDKIFFNYFFNKLLEKDQNALETNSFVKFVKILFNGEAITEEEEKIFPSYINSVTAELFLSLIDKYSHISSRINLLNNVSEEVKQLTLYKASFGLALYEANRLDEAAKIFDELMNENYIDPSIGFYLVSIYLLLEKYELIVEVIKKIETKHQHIPAVKEKLSILKQKFNGLL